MVIVNYWIYSGRMKQISLYLQYCKVLFVQLIANC